MGARKPVEERFFPRYVTVSAAFDGRLTVEGQELEARVIDVGRDGLGILADKALPKGAAVSLELADRQLTFHVVYCMDDLIHHGRYRCGLSLAGSSVNLVSLFGAAGFLAPG